MSEYEKIKQKWKEDVLQQGETLVLRAEAAREAPAEEIDLRALIVAVYEVGGSVREGLHEVAQAIEFYRP